ncbi:MAG: isocitrate lyase/PEP mutase family protein [Steroidobacteraceae bacterium]
MSSSLLERAERFRALHQAPGVFVIANAWDGASARILESLGFEAIATSSGAAAATLGRLDGQLTREEALIHSRVVASATSRPVSADLEQGFGDSPQVVAETVRLAAEAGLVGCSIEDSTRDPARPLYDVGLATERIAAAAQAARALPIPFTLTARCERFLQNNPDLDDTIRRLLAFERAGADVLFAPGLPDLAAVRAVCSVLSRPVNFMAGIRGKSFSVAELAAAGIKRVSLATSLYRAAVTGMLTAAREVRESGTFTYLDHILPTPELNAFLKHS